MSNIVGIVQDHASPFNIADNLAIPYFSDEETLELLGQHEMETGQLFEQEVKEKISQITANQPGLVNGFAYKLVEQCEGKPAITYEDYLKVEDWYLRLAIDKNVANILNKAKQYRSFVERLLYTDEEVEGRSDLMVNYKGEEYVIETKVYRDSYQAGKGLKQLAYYCQSVNIPEGLYLLFASNKLKVMGIEEGVREVEGIKIYIYIVQYDEEKDF